MTKLLAYCVIGGLLLSVIFNGVRSVWAAEGDFIFSSQEEFANGVDDTFDNKIGGNIYPGFVAENSVFWANCKIFGGEFCANTHADDFSGTGLLNQSTKMIAYLYSQPPASVGPWIADVGSNMGVISPAYAQGVGFSALSPLLPLWKAMRNIAYSFLIIVLLILGLMIMFRSKIDARTTIGIQSALPRIIVTLILITFSFPIAGLMIDLMYVILFLGINVISPQQAPDLQASMLGDGLFLKMFGIVNPSTWAGGLGSLGLGLVGIIAIPKLVAAKLLLKLIPVGVGTVVSGGLGLAVLLLGLAMLFAFIRIYFMLLQAYINILIGVIFAPIFLLGQAIPGQNQFQFGPWLKNLMANLSVFPTTALLIIIAGHINDSFDMTPWQPPLLGGIAETFTGVIIPLGLALTLPQLVLTVKKLFGAKSAIPVGAAFSRAVNTPMGMAQQAFQTYTQFRLLGQHR